MLFRLVAAGVLVLSAVGCCSSPPLAANASPARLAAVRVVVADSDEPVLRQNALASGAGSDAALVADALQIAKQPASRADLEALVARTRAGGGGPLGAGAESVGAIVPLGPRDLVFYSGALGSLRARPSVGLGAAPDPFTRFVQNLQSARPSLVEPYYLWEGRDLLRGPVPDDSSRRRAVARDKNWLWAPQHVRMDDAYKALAGRGTPSEVTVVHADTGYTVNCQFSDGQQGTPLHPTDGYNFFEPGPDPRDPNTQEAWTLAGVLTQPGHGTGTASVIASPHTVGACSPPTPWPIADSVHGIAPGATVVPVRYTNGIILGLPDWVEAAASTIAGRDLKLDVRVLNLAQTVFHASHSGDEWVKKRADVVSISQGGVCSEGEKATVQLQCALREAEARGVIVVAAAGQYPYHSNVLLLGRKPVTFPGKFVTTIGVAGSTIYARPWDQSARGPEVDITAPAEWVWRARTVPTGGGDASPPGSEETDVGDGTSFATAMTAGVAALWVQANGGHDALYERYGPAVGSAFRYVVKHTAQSPADLCEHLEKLQGEPPGYREELCRQSKQGWDERNWGPGILNAAGVLALEELPSRDQVCAEECERRERLGQPCSEVCPKAWNPEAPPAPLPCDLPAVAQGPR
jgi:hypothetical protein